MAETIPDLTDAQIEQLLSAAEVSLANKTSADRAVAVQNKQQSLAVAATATASAAQLNPGKAGHDTAAVKPVEEPTLRVPQLRVKNKKVSYLPTTLSTLLYDENQYPKSRMTQEEPPLWRQILHHNDSLFVIVTLTGLVHSL